MAGLRHDASKCREAAKSELIRRSLGIETPPEKAKRLEREQAQRQAAAKSATKGVALFGEEA